MKLTRDYIINHIRETKYPLWALFSLQNYKRCPIMYYNGDDFGENENADSKAEKSTARLNAVLSSLPPGVLLSIDLKSAKYANGSNNTTLGPFEFINADKEEIQSQQPPVQGFGGFGFVQPPPGWVSEETLAGKLEAIQAANERKINEILFKQKEDNFREQCRRERRELEEMRKELKDEKKKYESTTGAAAETLVFAVKKILAELFPNLPFAQGAQSQLSGAAQTDSEPPSDPKYRAVESLATSLYENPNLTEKDIVDITATINSHAHRPSQPTVQTAQEEPITVKFPGGEDGGDNV